MYGYTQTEDVAVKGGNYGVFGLNQNVFLTKFDFIENGGKGGTQKEALDIIIKINENSEQKVRFFELNKFPTESDEDFEKRAKVFSRTLIDYVECFVPANVIQTNLQNITTFKQFVQTLERLIKSVAGWDKKPLDVFLQYQKKISGTNNTTFLEVPRNDSKVYQGKFICPTQGPGFKRVEGEEALIYKNEAGVTHPFERNKWFMDSTYANQIKLQKVGNTPATEGLDWTEEDNNTGENPFDWSE